MRGGVCCWQNCCTIDYDFNVPVTSPYGKEIGEVEASTGGRRVRIDYSVLDGNYKSIAAVNIFDAYYTDVNEVAVVQR